MASIPQEIITYDGLPISSGGAHSLRESSPSKALSKIQRFIDSCCAPLKNPTYTIELIAGESIPGEFTDAAYLYLSSLYTIPQTRALGNETGYIWQLPEEALQQMILYLESQKPIPSDTYGLNALTVSVSHYVELVDPVTRHSYPNQGFGSHACSAAGFSQELGVSQVYGRLSSKSTVSLFLNFPFELGTDELIAAVSYVQSNLPFSLSKSHWKQWTLTKRGDSYKGRKVASPIA